MFELLEEYPLYEYISFIFMNLLEIYSSQSFPNKNKLLFLNNGRNSLIFFMNFFITLKSMDSCLNLR